jgi:pilus assembly protein CpaC
VIDALDSEGLVTVLAEPNITAVSGASANFLAGGEYPIPVPQGLGQVTIEFKKYGVSLDSVATIVDGGRIHLTVKPEVSQLSTTGEIILNGITIPALTTRRAETTVDLASGQSFAIAGLLSNNVTHNIQKVPGLGNIKVVGSLFKSDRFERSETELLIIVTPYIVRPSSHRLAVPTDGFIAPTDADRIVNGADYTQAKEAGPPPKTPGPVKVVHP